MYQEHDFVPVGSWKHCGSEDEKAINVNVRALTINTWVGGTFMLIQCEDHIQCKKNVAVELKRYIYIYIYTYIYIHTYIFINIQEE